MTLMKEIYTRSKNGVILWLGIETLSVRDPRSGRAIHYYHEGLSFLDEAQKHDEPKAWMGRTIGLDSYKGAWDSVRKLLNNTYWRRIWIVQELVCATSITVCCGAFSIGWVIFVMADEFWRDNKLFMAGQSEWTITEAASHSQWLSSILLRIVAPLISDTDGNDRKPKRKPAEGF